MLRRTLLAALLGAIMVLVGVSAARADDVFYFVTGFGDSGGSCAPSPDIPGAIACTTLRSAVGAASADQGEDEIYLQPGTYTLSSAIPLTTDVDIFGGNARTTFVQGTGTDRLFTTASGTNVTLYGMTLAGGVTTGDGGAIANSGTLLLFETRVTGNRAARGGGVANVTGGALQVTYSLVDANVATTSAGGIFTQGTLDVEDSTIALNHAPSVGGMISIVAQTVTLTHATVAGNVATGGTNPGGVSFAGSWTSNGSLFLSNDGDNNPSNCGSAQTGGSGNLQDGNGSDCGGTVEGPGPSAIALVDRDGMTDVVDVAGTQAKNFEQNCTSALDQRLGQRPLNSACDAGAYQEGVPAGAITPFFPIPTPTAAPPVGPAPTATPAPTPPPTPEFHKDVVVKPVSGKVRVKLAGTNTFIDLASAADIPLGSTIDTKAGRIQLSSVPKKNGKPQTATFFDGIFKITQPGGITDLKLNEALAACPKHGKASAAAKKKPKTRKLWGSGSGAFRTSGTYSAATVRGTEWLVQDSCAGTLTRVRKGVVNVRDNVRHKTIVVRAGHHYLAKPKR